MKPTAYALLLALLLALLPLHAPAQRITINPQNSRKVQAAEFFISHFYVDSLDEETVVENAINGMLSKLDPHSSYVRAKDVERSLESLNGSFEGIGVQFNIMDDTLVVVQPVSGGPSEKKGILAGDRIVTVDDTAIAGVKMTRDEIMKRLRGPKNSKVKLGIVRQGVKGINHFTVVRDKIPVHTLDAAYMVDDSIAYIRLSSFGATTHKEFLDAAQQLRQQGMRHLILDLQGNGGGYLSAAVEISNEFLPASQLIVYTEGRANPRQDYFANGRGSLLKGRVAVLVDSYTASASEIVSGAIQDNDRGKVIGRRTFGKGLVQRPFELPDHSVIRLTTAHYYSPSGRCIQKPYKMGDRKDYDDDFNHRLKSGELTTDVLAPLPAIPDSALQALHRELFPDSLKYTTLRLHRTVYGGGGIMPDVYVPLDTNLVTPLYRQLAAKSCIINAAIHYCDKHRKALRKDYPEFQDYLRRFDDHQGLEAAIRKEAATAHVDIAEDAWQQTRPMLLMQLKALVARDIWTISEYYQVYNEQSPIYQRGLQIIREP